MNACAPAWDTELAAQRAREAYRYVARTYPPGADLAPIGRAGSVSVGTINPGEGSR